MQRFASAHSALRPAPHCSWHSWGRSAPRSTTTPSLRRFGGFATSKSQSTCRRASGTLAPRKKNAEPRQGPPEGWRRTVPATGSSRAWLSSTRGAILSQRGRRRRGRLPTIGPPHSRQAPILPRQRLTTSCSTAPAGRSWGALSPSPSRSSRCWWHIHPLPHQVRWDPLSGMGVMRTGWRHSCTPSTSTY